MKKSSILQIYHSKETVFTFKDISILWGETNMDLVKSRVNYFSKTRKLYPIRRGIYAKDKNYNGLELATKIFIPSYISLETILTKEGVIFQHYKSIYVISYLSREIICDKRKYIYKKIKNDVLTNPLGLEKKESYFTATKERALLDILYLYGDYHFDNLKPINWKLCFEILPIYENKSLGKRLNSYYKIYAGHK